MEASPATRSKISLTKEFRIDIALLEIPVSGCTCFKTRGKLACWTRRMKEMQEMMQNGKREMNP